MPNITHSFMKAFKEASWLGWLGAAIAFIEAIFILYMFYIVAPRHSDLLKQIDVEMHCNLRWADLFKQRLEIERMNVKQDTTTLRVRSLAVAKYYRQFWSLQEDQFYYYNQGFLPDRLYLDWVYERIHEFRRNEQIGGVSFTDGWEQFGKSLTGTAQTFGLFVDFLRERKDDDRYEAKVIEIVHGYRAKNKDE